MPRRMSLSPHSLHKSFAGSATVEPELRPQFIKMCMEIARDRTRILLIFLFLMACFHLVRLPQVAQAYPAFLLHYRIGAYCYLLVSAIFSMFLWQVHRNKDIPDAVLKALIRSCWWFIAAGMLVIVFGDISTKGSLASYMLFSLTVCMIPIISFWETLALSTVNMACVLLYSIYTGASPSLAQQIVILYVATIYASHLLFSQIARAFRERQQMQELNSELSRLSETDQLTGLLNRRGMENHMASAPDMNARNESVGVLIVDIDLFKGYNDKYQHLAGDECLARVAGCLKLCARRSSDIVARYGGEEFMLILKDISEPDLVRFAQRVREQVENLRIPYDARKGLPYVTVSVGASHARPRAGDDQDNLLKELIDMADQQLYNAKNNGRNCVSYKGRIQPRLHLVNEASG